MCVCVCVHILCKYIFVYMRDPDVCVYAHLYLSVCLRDSECVCTCLYVCLSDSECVCTCLYV